MQGGPATQDRQIALPMRLQVHGVPPRIHFPIDIIATSTGPHAVNKMFPMA